jgi:hypothetical protein
MLYLRARVAFAEAAPARLLHIGRDALRYKMKKHGLYRDRQTNTPHRRKRCPRSAPKAPPRGASSGLRFFGQVAVPWPCGPSTKSAASFADFKKDARQHGGGLRGY